MGKHGKACADGSASASALRRTAPVVSISKSTATMPCQLRSRAGTQRMSLSRRADQRLVGRHASMKLDASDEDRLDCVIKAASGGQFLITDPATGRERWFSSPIVRRCLLPAGYDDICDGLGAMGADEAGAEGTARMDEDRCAFGDRMNLRQECVRPSSGLATTSSTTSIGPPTALPEPPFTPPSVTWMSADPTTAELLAPPTTVELALATGSYPPMRAPAPSASALRHPPQLWPPDGTSVRL